PDARRDPRRVGFGLGLRQCKGADHPPARELRQPSIANLWARVELDGLGADVDVDAAEIIEGGVRLREFLDGEAAAQHGEPKATMLSRRIRAEQAHPAQ